MNWLTRFLGGVERRSPEPPAVSPIWTGGRKPPTSWDEWIVATTDRSGFVREAAVNALARSGHGPALRALLGRLNDWVPEVRRAALEAVAAFLVEEHASSWSSALAQVATLARGGRADHSQILGRIAGFLVKPRVLAAVKAGDTEMSREGRRYLLRLEFEASDAEGRFDLLRSALQSPDVVVASIAASEIHTVAEPSRRLDLAKLACVSGFAPLRAAGLREAATLGERLPAALLEDLCLDSNAFVRSLALKSMTVGRERLLERTRQRFMSGATGRHRAVAFDVMCNLAPESAEPVASAACSDPAAAVRRAAFARLLASTAGLARDGLIQRILEDASAVVREVAIGQIKRGDSPPPLEWLKALLTRRPASLNSLVRAAIHLPPWTRLEFLLGALLEIQLDARSADCLQFDLLAWDRDIRRCIGQRRLGGNPLQVDAQVHDGLGDLRADAADDAVGAHQADRRDSLEQVLRDQSVDGGHTGDVNDRELGTRLDDASQ